MTSAPQGPAVDPRINAQIDQIDDKYDDTWIGWVYTIFSADHASTYASSEYVKYHLKGTSPEIQVTTSRCHMGRGTDDKDTVLVADVPNLGANVVLKWYGGSLWPWNGVEFDKTHTLIQTMLPKPFDPLKRSERKRSMFNNTASGDETKRRRPMTRPLTPGTESEDEGSIPYGSARSKGQYQAQPPRSIGHAALLSSQQRTNVAKHPSSITENVEQEQTYMPPSSQEHRNLSIRHSVHAQTAEPEDRAGDIDDFVDEDPAAFNTTEDSEDVMPTKPTPEPPRRIRDVSQAAKEAHTTFVFIDKDTGDQRRRAFWICRTLRELFWFAQLTNTIAPGSSRCALAVRIGTTTKYVGQDKDQDGFQEMLAAIWSCGYWKTGVELRFEVEVRELVLA